MRTEEGLIEFLMSCSAELVKTKTTLLNELQQINTSGLGTQCGAQSFNINSLFLFLYLFFLDVGFITHKWHLHSQITSCCMCCIIHSSPAAPQVNIHEA